MTTEDIAGSLINAMFYSDAQDLADELGGTVLQYDNAGEITHDGGHRYLSACEEQAVSEFIDFWEGRGFSCDVAYAIYRANGNTGTGTVIEINASLHFATILLPEVPIL